MFQLILNPIRDWKTRKKLQAVMQYLFQLILNPIRDWKFGVNMAGKGVPSSN